MDGTLIARSVSMGTVIWPDWPWPAPFSRTPPPPTPSERPDEAQVSHLDPSVPQKRPSVTELLGHLESC